MHSSRYDASFSLVLLIETVCAHRVGFATASLPISKDANIMSVQETRNQVLNLVKYLILGALLGEDFIKDEIVLLPVRLFCTSLGPYFRAVCHIKLNLLIVWNDKLALEKLKRLSGPRVSGVIVR